MLEDGSTTAADAVLIETSWNVKVPTDVEIIGYL